MKHWTEYDPEGPNSHPLTFNVNRKLWNYIEQNRGKKPRSQFIRDILIKTMENTEGKK